MPRVLVATEAEFDEGGRKIVRVNGVEIGILNVDGRYHAIPNNCPHQNGPLARGAVREKIVADVPDRGEWTEEEYASDCKVIRCPLHGWGFDVESGDNMADAENAPGIPTYDLVVEDGEIYLDL